MKVISLVPRVDIERLLLPLLHIFKLFIYLKSRIVSVLERS